jgi:hypothetical protein
MSRISESRYHGWGYHNQWKSPEDPKWVNLWYEICRLQSRGLRPDALVIYIYQQGKMAKVPGNGSQSSRLQTTYLISQIDPLGVLRWFSLVVVPPSMVTGLWNSAHAYFQGIIVYYHFRLQRPRLLILFCDI